MGASVFPILAVDESLTESPPAPRAMIGQSSSSAPQSHHRLPRAGERFRSALTRLTIMIAAEEMHAFRSAAPALRELWSRYPVAMQWVQAGGPAPAHLAEELKEVRRRIAFEISRHIRFPAAAAPLSDEGMVGFHEVPAALLAECDAITGAGISKLVIAHFTTRETSDTRIGGFCREITAREFLIALKVDKLPCAALDAYPRTAATAFLNHFRHELQHVATQRWARPGRCDPSLPGLFYWLQPDELSCVAAQTALITHLEGLSPADWRDLRDHESLTELRRWISRFGAADVCHGSHPISGRRACIAFDRMVRLHRAHLLRAFPILHGIGCSQLLEDPRSFLAAY